MIFWLHSSRDRMEVSGTSDPGSSPGGKTTFGRFLLGYSRLQKRFSVCVRNESNFDGFPFYYFINILFYSLSTKATSFSRINSLTFSDFK